MGDCCCCKKGPITESDSDDDLISPFIYDDRLAPLTQPVTDDDTEPDLDNNKNTADCLRIYIIDGRRAVFNRFISCANYEDQD